MVLISFTKSGSGQKNIKEKRKKDNQVKNERQTGVINKFLKVDFLTIAMNGNPTRCKQRTVELVPKDSLAYHSDSIHRH